MKSIPAMSDLDDQALIKQWAETPSRNIQAGPTRRWGLADEPRDTDL